MIIPCLTYDNCGGCRTTQFLPTFSSNRASTG
jgi:hypothetical protein